MGHFAITLIDGSVSIMQTVGKVTPEECLAKWHPDEFAKIVSHRPIDLADIPNDRTFRNAWKDDGLAVVHDMPRARGIKRDHIRVERKPMLEKLDTLYLLADEVGNDAGKARIATRKQALRDATADPAIDAATTAEELKTVDPQALRDER